MLTIQEIFDEIKTSGGLTPSRRLRDIATRFPDQVAFRDKRFGIWNEITYGEFWTQVQYVGSALNYFGIERSDKVAIHSENRPEWLIADIGIQSLGAISVGLYPTNPPAEVQYLLSHSESKILFAEDQEQVDKALEVSKDVPNLSKIIPKIFVSKSLFKNFLIFFNISKLIKKIIGIEIIILITLTNCSNLCKKLIFKSCSLKKSERY